jgi:hypothetical protein
VRGQFTLAIALILSLTIIAASLTTYESGVFYKGLKSKHYVYIAKSIESDFRRLVRIIASNISLTYSLTGSMNDVLNCVENLKSRWLSSLPIIYSGYGVQASMDVSIDLLWNRTASRTLAVGDVRVNITGFGFYLYTYRFTAELNLTVEPKLNANHILENVTVRLLREGGVPVDFLNPSSFKLYINNTLHDVDVEMLGGGVYVLKVRDLTVAGGDILVKAVDSRQIMVYALSSI